ncbi:MAG: hypothetical protein JW915_10450, partial [Chitinispirillaceae bacterium]|nr:hypothetical protein [Chitinispirillaceae bacterium]
SDLWAAGKKYKIPRRQTANAFMLKALDNVVLDGKLCLILPASALVAPTSKEFLADWLTRVRLEKVINFGDLRKILFNTAKQPCIVVVASLREEKITGMPPGDETFEYWVPKADVSFAFGRLSLHSSDRHVLQTQRLFGDNELLTSLFWGTHRDIATITRLRLCGTFNDLIGSKKRWVSRKGFHRKDLSISDPVESGPLHQLLFLDAKNFKVDGPNLDSQLLRKFPKDIETVARLPEELFSAFKNDPRIVFTDGISKQRSVRAVFSNTPFSFTSSVGAIFGPKNDEPLLRFAAAYLHSRLVQYLLLLTAYQINFERERVTLTNIKELPFVHPDHHEHPERAWEIVREVSDCLVAQEAESEILRCPYNPGICESLIFEYFDLNQIEQERIKEVADRIAPNLQPSSVENIDTTLQHRPNDLQIDGYSKALQAELEHWRDLRKGRGNFSVHVRVPSLGVCGPLGVVRIMLLQESRAVGIEKSDQALDEVLRHIIDNNLLPMQIAGNFYLAADAMVRHDNMFYLVKPLVSRLWLQSEAYRDAEKIVRCVLSAQKQEVQK